MLSVVAITAYGALSAASGRARHAVAAIAAVIAWLVAIRFDIEVILAHPLLLWLAALATAAANILIMGAANAATHKKAHHAASSGNAALLAQVKALQAEVESLRGEVETQNQLGCEDARVWCAANRGVYQAPNPYASQVAAGYTPPTYWASGSGLRNFSSPYGVFVSGIGPQCANSLRLTTPAA